MIIICTEKSAHDCEKSTIERGNDFPLRRAEIFASFHGPVFVCRSSVADTGNHYMDKL